MTHDDLIYRHRLRLFARAGEVGVSRACRELGFHRSTYYRWKARVEREGLAILRPRERRPPRMPNQTPVWVEERIVALALAMPGLGARRLAAQLAQPGWGGLRVSASGVAKVLARRGLSTRRRRLSLVAGYASPPEQPSGPQRREPLPVRHLDATQPGDLVGFDCFHIGRLSGTRAGCGSTPPSTWPAAMCGLRSTSPRSTRPRSTPPGWSSGSRPSWPRPAGSWARCSATTAASSARASSARPDLAPLVLGRTGAKQRFIRAGRPQTNGSVERVQRTILEECWRPTFARSLVPRFTALARDLRAYLGYYNHERAHTGRHTQGRTPAQIVYGSRKTRPR